MCFHREKVKEFSRAKYQNNLLHRQKVKEFSKMKYCENELHRHNLKAMSTRKYHGNPEHKKLVIARNKLRMQQIKQKEEQFDVVMEQFLDKVKDGPDFVCCVCHRLLFRHQVVKCRIDHYKQRKEIASIADKCITEDYLHKCNKDCVMPCQWLST